ncbi:MAG: hypothetical protein EA362_04550 [Saprospirales bacterium]|nr:MAG: hypothetical protein EA362_04550 [Saprospirales bacterium]
MIKDILILSGDTGEGKTTALLTWMNEGKKRVHGIFMPVENQKRLFYNPYMDVKINAEVSKSVKERDGVFEIGKFKFSKKSFKVAGSWLKMKPPLNTDFLIIDEIGPLELRGEGLEPELTDFLEKIKNGEINQTIILVVRKSLVVDVIDHYQLTNIKLIRKEDLSEL